LPRGRSRKRQRSKIQNDNTEPKVKKVRNIEPESLEIETIDENIELQPVSRHCSASIFLYTCFINVNQI